MTLCNKVEQVLKIKKGGNKSARKAQNNLQRISRLLCQWQHLFLMPGVNFSFYLMRQTCHAVCFCSLQPWLKTEFWCEQMAVVDFARLQVGSPPTVHIFSFFPLLLRLRESWGGDRLPEAKKIWEHTLHACLFLLVSNQNVGKMFVWVCVVLETSLTRRKCLFSFPPDGRCICWKWLRPESGCLDAADQDSTWLLKQEYMKFIFCRRNVA